MNAQAMDSAKAANPKRLKQLLVAHLLFFCIFVLVVGMLEFAIHSVEARSLRFHMLLARGRQTMATITEKRATSAGSFVHFRFTVTDRTYTGKSPVSPETFNTMIVGHVTPVVYLPEEPSQCELALSDVLQWASGLEHYWRILQIINGVACLLVLQRVYYTRKRLKAGLLGGQNNEPDR